MSGALKEKLVVVGLFSLFASVVIGGMAWATVATYKLAKDEHLSKVRLAIWRMARKKRFMRELVVEMTARLEGGHASLNDWTSFGEDLGLK